MRTLFGDLFDDFFDYNPARLALPDQTAKPGTRFMHTDIVEKDGNYEIAVDVPGFKKEDINVELDDNILTITAETSSENEEKKEDGKYIRRERYVGKQVRRMYVPKGTKQEDVKAQFEDGVLKITLPKEEPPKIEKKTINIE